MDPQAKVTLSIIIINYKCADIIEKCLASIQFNDEYEVIIVDNENNPALMDRLSRLSRIRIITYSGNLGFSGANNMGITQSKGMFVMTLNADVFLQPDYINNCVGFLMSNPEYSSIQGKLLLYNEKNLIDSTGNAITFTRLGFNENHRVQEHFVPSHEVFGACAAASIYRKSILEKIKNNDEYFDVDFFAYLEDLDLDWRIRLMGGKSFFLHTAQAFHIREFSSNFKFRLKQSLRNRMFMIIKNDSIANICLNIVWNVFVFIFFTDRIKNYRLIKKMFKKRSIIQSRKSVPDDQVKSLFQKTPWIKYIKKMLLQV